MPLLDLVSENVWLDRSRYEDAERQFYEEKAKEIQTPLAAEVGRAREWLTNIKNCIEEPTIQFDTTSVKRNNAIQDHLNKLENVISLFEAKLHDLIDRVTTLEEITKNQKQIRSLNLKDVPVVPQKENDDDVDLFASDSEEDEATDQVRQKLLKDYEEKKSKKPVLIAKSNIILDVKPWDDETNMKDMENAVRKIETDGLIWGAAKLVPLAFGISKLQISCVVEDDLVSVDWLQEQIEEITDLVQSVDIAAFNKV